MKKDQEQPLDQDMIEEDQKELDEVLKDIARTAAEDYMRECVRIRDEFLSRLRNDS